MNTLVSNKNIVDVTNRIKTDGICVVKNYIDSDTLALIEKEFDNILNNNYNYDKNLGKNKCLRTNMNTSIINNKLNYNIFNIFNSNFIHNTTTTILGKKWTYDKIFIHQDFENVDTNNTYPHFDHNRKLKFYICVNDMGRDNGCFKTLPGSLQLTKDKRKINPRMNIFTPGHRLYNGTEIKIEDLISVECNGGDLIVFDTNCIHAGGNAFKEGQYRKVIRLHIS
jgi:ectoine hydroxylase-related dioxygenase (phytanoyl-CoA dioxygenase family)